jgi:hypothetical protein
MSNHAIHVKSCHSCQGSCDFSGDSVKSGGREGWRGVKYVFLGLRRQLCCLAKGKNGGQFMERVSKRKREKERESGRERASSCSSEINNMPHLAVSVGVRCFCLLFLFSSLNLASFTRNRKDVSSSS